MSAPRHVPATGPVVASLCGAVVAAVSWTMGVVAHGMASTGPGAVTVGGLLAALAASGLVGGLSSRAMRHRPAGLVAPTGLVAGQVAVHLALSRTAGVHGAHSGVAHASGHAAHHMSTPAEHAALVRHAMDAGVAAGHGHMSWTMLAAHALATVVAGALLLLIAGWLGWLGVHLHALAGSPPVPVGERPPRVPATGLISSSSWFLLSRGGVRGPPLPA